MSIGMGFSPSLKKNKSLWLIIESTLKQDQITKQHQLQMIAWKINLRHLRISL